MNRILNFIKKKIFFQKTYRKKLFIVIVCKNIQQYLISHPFLKKIKYYKN